MVKSRIRLSWGSCKLGKGWVGITFAFGSCGGLSQTRDEDESGSREKDSEGDKGTSRYLCALLILTHSPHSCRDRATQIYEPIYFTKPYTATATKICHPNYPVSARLFYHPPLAIDWLPKLAGSNSITLTFNLLVHSYWTSAITAMSRPRVLIGLSGSFSPKSMGCKRWCYGYPSSVLWHDESGCRCSSDIDT